MKLLSTLYFTIVMIKPLLFIIIVGGEGISWLGNLNYLSPISDFSESPYGDDDNRTPFPVRPKEKRSYAQSCVVWVKAIGLQVIFFDIKTNCLTEFQITSRNQHKQ